MRIGETIYEEHNGIVDMPLNSKSIGLKGVWALYGKTTEKAEYECLNVGKGKDIGSEIVYDLGCFHYIPFKGDGTRKYINQFGYDCNFNYKPGQTQEYLYPYLALKYTYIKFIFIHNENDLTKEIEYANQVKAHFWRNGRPYSTANKQNTNLG